jgi:prolyl 4-hydroxylase
MQVSNCSRASLSHNLSTQHNITQYFGQEHWVTTRETHIVKDMPANDKSLDAKDYSRLLQYRSQDEPILNLTLKVLSVAPRVFEITGFLSHTEVDHILQVATDEELSLSSVGTEDELDVRSSFNSWLERDTSTIIDIIYRRAADLMRIDEAMLRVRHANERPELDYRGSAAESLQLVHYAPNQSYNEHHDFGYPYVESPYQSERFATLLFYLNVPESGGTTSFPRWVNAETSEGLKAVPEIGKAVLFYDQLPGRCACMQLILSREGPCRRMRHARWPDSIFLFVFAAHHSLCSLSRPRITLFRWKYG